MKNYIEIMKNNLTQEEIEFLKNIYAPTVMTKGYSNAFRSLTIMPDGEIRCYGNINKSGPDDEGTRIYISSKDCGLSWKMHKQKENSLGAAARSPYSNRYIMPNMVPGKDGEASSMYISEDGPDSTVLKEVPLSLTVGTRHMPLALKGKKRWIFAADYQNHTTTFVSDDDGDSWKNVPVEKTDCFTMVPPHKGKRWENSGVEPAIVELNDDRLMMILRTSTDYHYVAYSYDYGDSWTKPEPSTFHSTLTNPELLRLSDGRILFFYNNTRPLPEQDLKSVWPTLTPQEQAGEWEDVFTNRDANCVVISEDNGKSWKGFRELYLNEIRNSCDFRSSGGNYSARDKSVHQFQAIELPYNKVMVHVGQHEMLNKIVIFDINWLYEKEHSENFRDGMSAISTQVYLKSVSGGFRGFTGHCAWNRTNGAVMVPDPDGNHTEVLLLKNTDDDRLVSNAQGAVWNFPAAQKGTVNITLDVFGKGIRISLADHWINPIDLTVEQYAQFTKVLTREDLVGNGKKDIEIEFDTTTQKAQIKQGKSFVSTLDMQNTAPNGLCYLHLQTVSDKGDSEGTIIKCFSFKQRED